MVQQCDAQQRTELVTQFVDFSSKYGLGYKLSNGSYGVLFNDSTKIITHPNLFHFDYIEKSRSGGESATNNTQNTDTMSDHIQQFNFFDYPESINKKVVLLQHFKSYLDGNQKFKPLEFDFTKDNMPERPQSDQPLSYIKKWKRAKKAILLRNTNKVIQVLFQDQSELILCSGSGFVTFVNAKQEVKTVPLNCANQNFEITDKSLFKRLQYAKEVLVQMMTGSPLPSSLGMCDEPRRPASNNEVTSPAPITVAPKATGMQSSRIPQLKQTKSAAKNLLLSPDNQK